MSQEEIKLLKTALQKIKELREVIELHKNEDTIRNKKLKQDFLKLINSPEYKAIKEEIENLKKLK